MPDISILFHALPEETRDFVTQFVVDFDLRVVAMRYRPFDVVEVDRDQLDVLFVDSSDRRRLHFFLEAPALDVADELEFGDQNPDALRLDLGERTPDALTESWLSARTENVAALTVWKQIASRLRAVTKKGALAVQPRTGAAGPARGHRYTALAKSLEASGELMLTLTGVILKLGQSS